MGSVLLWAVIMAVGVPLGGVLLVEAAASGTGTAETVVRPSAPMRLWTVTQEYGCTGVPMEPAREGCPHFHSGLDLVGPRGAEVLAVWSGRAEVVLAATGFGLHVVLRHADGLSTLYGHLDGVAVSSGAYVSEGQVIGYEGCTGNSTGPHLHFEVRSGDQPLSPREVFKEIFGSDSSSDAGTLPVSPTQGGNSK